jgi:hypothetical protein
MNHYFKCFILFFFHCARWRYIVEFTKVLKICQVHSGAFNFFLLWWDQLYSPQHQVLAIDLRTFPRRAHYHFQHMPSLLLWLFLHWVYHSLCLLASNCCPPTSASQVARDTGIHSHAWPLLCQFWLLHSFCALGPQKPQTNECLL